MREGELGPRLADKLFKVWMIDGSELWMLIHTEVQNRQQPNFAERMYVYNYRIRDRLGHDVVSLAVLTDERKRWRPREFSFRKWGFSLRMQFPVAKLLDYAKDIAALEANPNPFAAIVMAHWQTIQTRKNPEERYRWKVRLVKSLFHRGLTAEQIRQLFRLIDWMMTLPPELEKQFTIEIHQFEEEQRMPYITSVERVAKEEGKKEGKKEGIEEGRRLELRNGIELALELKFGAAGLELMPLVQGIHEVNVLQSIRAEMRTAESVEQIRQLIGSAEEPK
jgi:hypothetical protein